MSRCGCKRWYFGVDEAGYGPKLGPLVLAAYAVAVGQRAAPDTVPAPVEDILRSAGVADSKQLYRGRHGLARLERVALALMAAADGGRFPGTLGTLWRRFCCGAPPGDSERAFGRWQLLALPLATTPNEVDDVIRALRDGFAACHVDACTARVRVVFPAEFNRVVAACGSKNVALAQWTTELLRALAVDRLPQATVIMDRQGGRKNYAQLLWNCSDSWAEVACRPGELWQARSKQAVLTLLPRTKADQLCALTAAASIVAKYVRELFMHLWNRFWCARVKGLRPTAGYPQDAGRFWQRIQPLVCRLGLEPQWLLRDR